MDNTEAKAIRERLGLTQSQLATLLGYENARSISSFERDKSPTPVPRLLALLLKAYDDGYRPDDWPRRTKRRRASGE